MATIGPIPPPGPIEAEMASASGREEKRRVKVEGLVNIWRGLTPNQRNRFTMQGVTVRLVAQPVFIRDSANRIIGLEVQVTADDTNGQLPVGDGIHRVINPPLKMPNGTVHMEPDPRGGPDVEVANMEERPALAIRQWLFDSVVAEAKRLGWTP